MLRGISNQIRSQRGLWLPWLIALVLVTAARVSGNLQFLERAAFDYLLKIRPAEPTDERILIVGIDEADIRRLDTYPVPDADLAGLIQKLQQQQPAVIGIDIVRDLPVPREDTEGHNKLVQIFQASRENKDIIGIEKALSGDFSTIAPPPALPPDQIGFIDNLLDSDGKLRRSLLGAPSQNTYRQSLAIRLADRYLSKWGFPLENGVADPSNMRFGPVELKRLQSNTGSYVGVDAGGNQILLNFRSGKTPFRTVTMQQIIEGSVPAEWIRDRIVLIGMTALSTADFVTSDAIDGRNPVLNFGVEVHAHAVSQITSAVLDGRSLINSWIEGWEYVWIAGWGVIGIIFSRAYRSSSALFLSFTLASLLLTGICYVLLISGWWIPLIPPLLVLLIGTTATTAYRYDRNLKAQIRDRELIIENTFTQIHRFPLQSISGIRRELHGEISTEVLKTKIEQLDKEVRDIYDFMREHFLKSNLDPDQIYIPSVDAESPVSELLSQTLHDTWDRNFPGFRTIKHQLPDFHNIDNCDLTSAQKQGLCLFLEDALCNVGKHAIGATKLQILYKSEKGRNIFQIIDNGLSKESVQPAAGSNSEKSSQNRGSQQARAVARLFRGEYSLRENIPHGKICELVWPEQKGDRWKFWKF